MASFFACFPLEVKGWTKILETNRGTTATQMKMKMVGGASELHVNGIENLGLIVAVPSQIATLGADQEGRSVTISIVTTTSNYGGAFNGTVLSTPGTLFIRPSV